MSPIFIFVYTQAFKMTDTLVYPYWHVKRLSNIFYGLDHVEDAISLYLLISSFLVQVA
jgi:hypothetical protein